MAQAVMMGRMTVKMTINPAVPTGQALASLFEAVMGSFSVSDHEGELADAIEALLRRQPHLQVHRMGDTVIAATHLGREHRVILAGHLDTVPVIDNFPPRWLDPGDPLIDPGIAARWPASRVMWGRGACDMKASVAVLLDLAVTMLEPKYDLTYVFYDHEEVRADLNGLRRAAERHPDWLRGDLAVIGEPTNCAIEGGCNGSMRFDVITHGVAAHSAHAWKGVNAIHKAAAILNRLNSYQPRTISVEGLEYAEGLNATMIQGGTGTNVIPKECRVHVNYRFAPDKALTQAKALMMGEDAGAELGNGEHAATGGVFEGFGIEMQDESPSARPGLNAPLGRSLVDLVRSRTGAEPTGKLGWTDVARFALLGIPALNLGAGDPDFAHSHDEQVPLDDLLRYADLLGAWLR